MLLSAERNESSISRGRQFQQSNCDWAETPGAACGFSRAGEAELAAKSDMEVLQIAAAGGRILVTHDWKTMPAAFERFTAKQQSSGVLIVPQRLAVGRAIEELLLVWAASDAEDWENVLCPIPF